MIGFVALAAIGPETAGTAEVAWAAAGEPESFDDCRDRDERCVRWKRRTGYDPRAARRFMPFIAAGVRESGWDMDELWGSSRRLG